MANLIYTIAAVGDHGKAGSTQGADGTAVGKSASAANPNFFIILGDTYPIASATNMAQYNTTDFFTASNLSMAKTIHVPGNHDNGIGDGGTDPDIRTYQSYWAGSPSVTASITGFNSGVSPLFNQFLPATSGSGSLNTTKILCTDRYIDFPPGGSSPWRFFFLNDGAIVSPAAGGSATPGWPVPFGLTSLYPTEAQITAGTNYQANRVAWLRANWLPGNHNVVCFHHPLYSPAAGHADNPSNNYIAMEMIGGNDGSLVQHAELMLSGHTHQHQIVNRRDPRSNAITTGLGVVQVGEGAGALLDTGVNSGQASNAQFIGVTNGYTLLQFYDDNTLHVSQWDAGTGAGTAAAAASGFSTSNSTVTFTQTVTSTPVPQATVSADVTFPNTNPGSISPAQTVSITNTGDPGSTLTIAANGISIKGFNPNKFVITGGTSTSAINLTQGQSQSVTVTFNPAASDAPGTAFQGNVSFTDNAGNVAGTIQSVHLAGSVTVSGPVATLSNTSLAFSVAAGSASSPQTLTVTNTGTTPLHISNPASTAPVFGFNAGTSGVWATAHSNLGGGFGGWRGYGTPGNSIPTSGYPAVASGAPPAGVNFRIISLKPDVPTFLGGSLDTALSNYASRATAGDWLTLWHEGESNDGWTPSQITQMHARAYPIVKAANPNIFYGQISTGFAAEPNQGGPPNLAQWLAPGLDFQTVDGYSPNAQSIATVFGNFLTAVRSVDATVPVGITETNAQGTTLHTTGVSDPTRAAWFKAAYAWAVANDCLVFFPFFFDVGSSNTNNYNWDNGDTATVSELEAEISSSSGTTGSSGLALSGTDSALFSLSSDTLTGKTIAPGSSGSVNITFSPPSGATGTKNAVLTISDDSGGTNTTQTVTLTGTETSTLGIGTLSDTTFDFGTVAIGNTGISHTFSITNTGGNPSNLSISAVALTGGQTSRWNTISDSGNATLAFGQSRTVTLQFTGIGASAGSKAGGLQFTTNTGGVAGTNQTINLTGTIVASGTPVGTITPASPINFGNVPVATTQTQTVTITNTGSSALHITGASIS